MTSLVSSMLVLVLTILGSWQADAQTRNPRLFLVTTSSTTSTLRTSAICYQSAAAAPVACTGRKRRRAVITDMLDSQAGLGEEIAREIIESSNVEDDTLIAA